MSAPAERVRAITAIELTDAHREPLPTTVAFLGPSVKILSYDKRASHDVARFLQQELFSCLHIDGFDVPERMVAIVVSSVTYWAFPRVAFGCAGDAPCDT